MESSLKHLSSNIEKMYSGDKRYFGFYADLLHSTGDTQKALRILKENINSFPDYSTGELVLGELLYNMKKYDQAEMLFKGAVRKDRTCVKALKYLAAIEEMKGNKKDQIDLLMELLKYDPFDQDARTIVRLNEKDFSIPSENEHYDEADLISDESETEFIAAEPQKTEPAGLESKVEIPVSTQAKAESELQESIKDEIVSILDSSDDIDIPDIPFDKDEDIMKKHIFGDEVLNKEQSFAEDIIESLDILTQSYVEEDIPQEKEKDSSGDFTDLVKTVEAVESVQAVAAESASAEVLEPSTFKAEESEPAQAVAPVEAEIEEPAPAQAEPAVEKREYDENYKDKDPKIAKILNDLFMDVFDYKRKMDSDAKLVDENPESYDELVEFARSKFRYAAANAKKEILYYSKKNKDEPRNEKYSQNLKFFREEILRLDKELVEELNMLKNEYY
jgi:hypothetical protein